MSRTERSDRERVSLPKKLVFSTIMVVLALCGAEWIIRITGVADHCDVPYKNPRRVCDPIFNFKNNPAMKIHGAVTAPRFYTLLLSSFAAVALVLAAVGIYGTMAYTVGQRTREIGVRMALGADATNVLHMVVREGLVLSAMGIAIGLAGALLLSRTLASFLFGVTTTDLTTFTVVSLILLVVAVAACYFPARRAASLDPATTLRSE